MLTELGPTSLFITRLEGIDEKWKWLGERLPETWSSDSLKSAPHLRFLAERLIDSQTVDEDFWPWKDGTVSIELVLQRLLRIEIETSDLEKCVRELMTAG